MWIAVPLAIALLSGSAAYVLPMRSSAYAFPETKVWMHRRNDAASGIAATRAGTAGIELDIMMRDGLLVVSHDGGELQGAQTLDAYLQSLDEADAAPHLWLDLKTLGLANQGATRTQLLELRERYGLADRLLVESPRPLRMMRLCAAPLTCSVWLKHVANPLHRVFYRMSVRLLSNVANVAAVSVDYRAPQIADGMVGNEVPLLLYTFPPASDLGAFQSDPRIRVLLSD